MDRYLLVRLRSTERYSLNQIGYFRLCLLKNHSYMPLKKIFVRIEGGLGNQMFQYAAARSLADRLGCELLLDLRGLAENGNRPYQLNAYCIRANLAQQNDLDDLPNLRPSRSRKLRSRLSHWVPAVFSYPVFWANTFAYDRRFESIKKPVYMSGYWQSELYFLHNRQCILDDFQPIYPLDINQALLRKILSTNSVALHIRRGDYVSNPSATQFHGLCTLDYYKAAIQSLKARMQDAHIFIFSDDLEWARSNLASELPMDFVDSGNGPSANLVDLELISSCRHHIIANSSFSWWGAWRGKYDGQRVIAPSRWFADTTTDTRDVIPARWEKI